MLTKSFENIWAQTLGDTADHPTVSPRPSPLFWFTSSELFTRLVENGKRPQPLYLEQPEWIFKAIWASPVDDAPQLGRLTGVTINTSSNVKNNFPR